VEDFSVGRLRDLEKGDLARRTTELRAMMSVGRV
jgi:hypothetical protein